MSEPSILAALREKLRPGPDVVMAMPKIFSPECLRDALATKRSGAEARLADATRTYQKATLDVERGVPGAASRKSEAAAALREAEEYVRDVLGAQIEVEAEVREAEHQARAQREAAEDGKANEALKEYEAAAAAFVALCGPINDAFAHLLLTHGALCGLLRANPRLSTDSVGVPEGLVSAELARTSQFSPHSGWGKRLTLPAIPELIDPERTPAMASSVASFAKAVRADLEKAAKARARGGRR